MFHGHVRAWMQHARCQIRMRVRGADGLMASGTGCSMQSRWMWEYAHRGVGDVRGRTLRHSVCGEDGGMVPARPRCDLGES